MSRKTKTDDHATPDRVFSILLEHGIDAKTFFDPCPLNADFDGLKINWKKTNFVNPPYKLLEEFVVKALEERNAENYSVMLLPAKTDQDWYHDYILKNNFKIIWIRKRLMFGDAKRPATTPHFLVIMS